MGQLQPRRPASPGPFSRGLAPRVHRVTGELPGPCHPPAPYSRFLLCHPLMPQALLSRRQEWPSQPGGQLCLEPPASGPHVSFDLFEM